MPTKALFALAAVIVFGACTDTGTVVTDLSGTTASTAVQTTDNAPPPEPPPASAGFAATAPVENEEGTGPSAADIALPDVLSATPSQGEGPYYPVTKPDDRDYDLLSVNEAVDFPAGTPLQISGLLVDTSGDPLVGAVIEIWQVDGYGIYDHPNYPGTENRDRRFQFYGEVLTDGDGFWTFLTLDPVLYESRPRHIHAKVKIDGIEVLTTQIYFEGDEEALAEDGLAAAAGAGIDLLTAAAAPGTLSNGLDGLVATHVIVIDA